MFETNRRDFLKNSALVAASASLSQSFVMEDFMHGMIFQQMKIKLVHNVGTKILMTKNFLKYLFI